MFMYFELALRIFNLEFYQYSPSSKKPSVNHFYFNRYPNRKLHLANTKNQCDKGGSDQGICLTKLS